MEATQPTPTSHALKTTKKKRANVSTNSLLITPKSLLPKEQTVHQLTTGIFYGGTQRRRTTPEEIKFHVFVEHIHLQLKH